MDWKVLAPFFGEQLWERSGLDFDTIRHLPKIRAPQQHPQRLIDESIKNIELNEIKVRPL